MAGGGETGHRPGTHVGPHELAARFPEVLLYRRCPSSEHQPLAGPRGAAGWRKEKSGAALFFAPHCVLQPLQLGFRFAYGPNHRWVISHVLEVFP